MEMIYSVKRSRAPRAAPGIGERLDFNRPNRSDWNAHPDASEIRAFGQVLQVTPTATSQHLWAVLHDLCLLPGE